MKTEALDSLKKKLAPPEEEMSEDGAPVEGAPDPLLEEAGEAMPDVEVAPADDADENSDTPGADEAAAVDVSGEPGALIAERLGRSPEDGKALLDAAAEIPMFAEMDEPTLADMFDQDLDALMRVEMKAAEMGSGKPPEEEMPAEEPPLDEPPAEMPFGE